MQDLNTPTEQSGIKLCLQAEFKTSNKKGDKGQLEFTQLGRWGGLCLHVGGCACMCAFKCAHVCRCALGLYHHRDNKVSRVICKLSGENFPAEALISFLLQLIVPKNTKPEPQLLSKTQTWRETITYSAGLRFSSQTGRVFICQSQ